jgi:AraC-like DNA-binding protein
VVEAITNFHMLGALQGIVLAAALIMRRQNSLANRILGTWILLLSFGLVSRFLMEHQFYLEYPHFTGADHSFPLLYGPLFYLYVRTLISPRPSFGRQQLLHFLPFLLHQVYFVPSFYAQSGSFKLQFMQSMMEQGPPVFIQVSALLKVLHGSTYVSLTLLLLRTHARSVCDSFSNIEKVSLHWLYVLAGLQVVIWGTALVVNVVEFFGIYLLPAGLIYVMVAVMVYATGYFALRQPEIFATTAGQAAEPMAATKYEKTRLDEDKAQQYLQELIDHMKEEKPFMRSTLTLQELADELSIASHQLSQVINDRLQKNFFDFINSYRVEEVQVRLLAPEAQNLTILAVALDSGFSSKSSFNTIFKKHTQMTPTEYKRHSGE